MEVFAGVQLSMGWGRVGGRVCHGDKVEFQSQRPAPSSIEKSGIIRDSEKQEQQKQEQQEAGAATTNHHQQQSVHINKGMMLLQEQEQEQRTTGVDQKKNVGPSLGAPCS